ncbi:MAG: ArnT family glycosyltransferase [Acidimicrobiia bacterium]
MSGRRFVVALLVIAGVAFVGRATYILTVTRHETGFYDRVYYQGSAERLAAGEWFKFPPSFGDPDLEDALHPPLTALVLTPAARVTADSDLAMRFTVALAGVGVVLLAGLIGREVAGSRVGLVAAGLAAVYPNLWMNDGLIMAETFATLATAATVFFAYRLLHMPTWRNAAAAGVSCALAMLSRGELFLLVPLVAVPAALLVKGATRDRRFRLAGVVVLSALLVVAPWVAYNLARFEKPVFLSNGDGGVVAGANCDQTYWGPELGSWHGLCHADVGGDQLEGSLNSEQKREAALEYMRDHLGRLPVVVIARIGRSWSVYKPLEMIDVDVTEGRPRWASWAGLGMYWALVPLSVAGVVVLRRRAVPLFPLVGPLIVSTLVAGAFYGRVRFRAPAEVSLVVLAAVAAQRLIDRAPIGPLQTLPSSYPRGEPPPRSRADERTGTTPRPHGRSGETGSAPRR